MGQMQTVLCYGLRAAELALWCQLGSSRIRPPAHVCSVTEPRSPWRYTNTRFRLHMKHAKCKFCMD